MRLGAAAKIDGSGRSRAYTVAREAAAASARTVAVGRATMDMSELASANTAAAGATRLESAVRLADALRTRGSGAGRTWSAPRLEPALAATGVAAGRDVTDPLRPRDEETVPGVPRSVERKAVAERALASSGVDSAPCEIAVELIGAFPSIGYFPMAV